MTPRLRATAIVKDFSGARALDGASIDVRPGEVLALMGENGAGKSTLGRIIAGVHRPDSGRVELDGVTLRDLDEARARALGIGIVHQEGSLVAPLSVAENIFAGRPPTRSFGRIDRAAMRARTRALLDELGVTIDPETPAGLLSPARAQVVEIAKALSRDLRLLILDEPTASLTPAETERLFAIVRRLTASGVAVIQISHRLTEVLALCDRATVLRDGRVMGTRRIAETDEASLIRLMVGRDVAFARAPAGGTGPGAVVLEASGVTAPPHVRGGSLTAREGEIVCLAGLVGAGRSEFCETLFGVRPLIGGTIRFAGERVRWRGPWQAMRAGIGMVPEDRKAAGLFLDQSVTANICAAVLPSVSRRGVISDADAGRLADRFIADLRIAASSRHQVAGTLSGGNQQKVLLAKWLAAAPRLLIVDEPTRGVDVGARADIHRILRGLRARGTALLVVSSDLPEVLALADRIVVMAGGCTVGEIDGAGATEEDVMRLATRPVPGAPERMAA